MISNLNTFCSGLEPCTSAVISPASPAMFLASSILYCLWRCCYLANIATKGCLGKMLVNNACGFVACWDKMSLLGQDVSFFTGSEECWEGWIKCRILSWDSKLPRPPQDLWTRKSSAATQIPLSGRELHWKIGNKRKQWWQGRGHCVHNAAWGENLCLWPGCYTIFSQTSQWMEHLLTSSL